MDRKIAIVLTVLFTSVGIRDVFTILYFYGNQTFIAKNLCVNKDLPEKNCHGTCFLSKLLGEDGSGHGENLPLNRLFDHFELKVLPSEISTVGMLSVRLIERASCTFDNSLYQSDFFARVFQPPEKLS